MVPAGSKSASIEAPTVKAETSIHTVDEGDLELVCEAPPPKKKAPMVVDLTLSSSESDDDEPLSSIKERLLKQQQSSGSQSSRPSTADSVGDSTSGNNC